MNLKNAGRLAILFVVAILVVLVSPRWNAGAQSQHAIVVSWTASTTAGVSYNVYRGTAAGGPYAKLNGAPQSALAYTDASGAGGTKYFYVIRAFDGVVESGNSNEVSATFLANPAPPTALGASAQ